MYDQSYSSYLDSSAILDFKHPRITRLIESKNWRNLNQEQQIKAVYDFVRDEIAFGYNASDQLPASQVLADGYGQCNTKGSLLMALLRALGIPCRFHGFTIYNALQKGAIPAYLIPLAPARIIHSWVEVLFEGQWYTLEGFILDKPYLSKIQCAFPGSNEFKGYGIATPCLQNPPIEWQRNHTYIQKEGIADDFGLYSTPDDFYQEHGDNLSGLRKILFRLVFRHLMNRNVRRIRRLGLKSKRVGTSNTKEIGPIRRNGSNSLHS